jgi:hypothetical protein
MPFILFDGWKKRANDHLMNLSNQPLSHNFVNIAVLVRWKISTIFSHSHFIMAANPP